MLAPKEKLSKEFITAQDHLIKATLFSKLRRSYLVVVELVAPG
jgi:hypothetical protein